MPEIQWKAETLRATAFYNVGETPKDVNHLWRLITHREPLQVTSRSAESLHIAEGTFGSAGNQLQCTIRPERVDWVLLPSPPLVQPIQGLITVGPLEVVLPPFQDLSARWLQMSSAINRLAFGAVLLVEVDDLPGANEILCTLLPSLNLDLEGVADFLYRVNRRRNLSSIPDNPVNRLSTWSVAQGGSVQLTMIGNVNPQVTRQDNRFACRLELDVNTVGMFPTPLGEAKAADLFNDLVNLGKEISEKGDIP